MRYALTLFIGLLVLGAASSTIAGAEDIPEGERCHVCSMAVAPGSAYSAQALVEGKALYFCDIGDMLYYHFRKGGKKQAVYYVRDMKSLEWINAREASFVKSPEFSTPMEWGIAAFAQSEDAENHGRPMSFKDAVQSLND